MSPQVWAAVIAGCIALISLPVTNYFTSRSEAKAKETAFKIDCYQKFVNAFFGLAEFHELNSNYESGDKVGQWQLLDKILHQMRLDVIGRSDSVKMGYSFPVILTDIKASTRTARK
jgi:hypothetical protein